MRVSIEASRKFQHGECRNAWNGNALFLVHSRTHSLLKRTHNFPRRSQRLFSHESFDLESTGWMRGYFTELIVLLKDPEEADCDKCSGNDGTFVKNSLRPRSTFHSLRDPQPKFVLTRNTEKFEIRNPSSLKLLSGGLLSRQSRELSTGNERNGYFTGSIGIPNALI